MADATKFMVLTNNLFRYSEQEAQDGSYLNAVVILNQILDDVNRKLHKNTITEETARELHNKIEKLKAQYLAEAKSASPRKIIYDTTDNE